MAAEGEVVLDTNDVLRVVSVRFSQGLEDSNLNLALLVELLPVLQDLQSDYLLLLVVVAPNDDTKGSSAQLLLDFVPEVDMILCFVEVVSLVVVEAVVVHAAGRLRIRVLVQTCQLVLDKLTDALILTVHIEVVDGLKRGHFVFFKLRHAGTIFLNELM